jgi:hypothetical protein
MEMMTEAEHKRLHNSADGVHCKNGHELPPLSDGLQRCPRCHLDAKNKRLREKYRTDPEYRAKVSAWSRKRYQRKIAGEEE